MFFSQFLLLELLKQTWLQNTFLWAAGQLQKKTTSNIFNTKDTLSICHINIKFLIILFSENIDRLDEWIIHIINLNPYTLIVIDFNLAKVWFVRATILTTHYWDLFPACLNIIQNEIINVILDLESLTFPIRITCPLSNETDSIDLPLSNHDKLPKWKKKNRITLHFHGLKPLTLL